MSIKEGNNMTQKLMRIYKGKLSEVAAQIKREAKEDKIYNFHWLLDKMLAAGNITVERAAELKRLYPSSKHYKTRK